MLLPLWMFCAWVLTPKKKLTVAIVDKTVMTQEGQEHVSLTWILNHQRFTKNNTSLYRLSNDYFGFFPEDNEKFRLKGLERFSSAQLDKLSNDADLTYITDAYGINNSDWYRSRDTAGILYGGMSEQDVDFLQMMKEKHKLVITEFNCIASPTSERVRERFEGLFHLKWTGWTGSYFKSLDSTSDELPGWIIRGYRQTHQGAWPFKRSGIVFVNEDNRIIVLENKTHLNTALPILKPTPAGMTKFDLPEKICFSYWFDIMVPDTTVNKVLAQFTIPANEKGRTELEQNGIPTVFPAIQAHIGNDYQFYYFSADFCDNPITMTTSYFKGVSAFKFLYCNKFDVTQRGSFFWNFYKPIITTILRDYWKQTNKATIRN